MIQFTKNVAVLTLFAATLVGCSGVSIIPFDQEGPKKTYPPVPASQVLIYKTVKPFKNYVELGQISRRTKNGVNMESVFESLREEAGKYGAEAIIGFGISSTTATETTMKRVCMNNICTMRPEMTTVSYHNCSGTMIRKK
ncbi:MAG: hypothetical protein JNL01_15935 [Bdellovibrionales bacterium]|nr:hypothetical protein [Bdellovibrionales bacterium]